MGSHMPWRAPSALNSENQSQPLSQTTQSPSQTQPSQSPLLPQPSRSSSQSQPSRSHSQSQPSRSPSLSQPSPSHSQSQPSRSPSLSQPSRSPSLSQPFRSRQLTQIAKNSESLEKANWDNAKTEVFIRICVEEVQAGNRPSTHFNKMGWENIVKKFEEGTGHKYNRVQLKNRWDTLKKEWGLWTTLLLECSGLGWDHHKQTIDADDQWWDEKCQKNRDWARFRTRGPLLVQEQEILFSDVVATGTDAWTPSSGLLPPHLQDEADENVDGSQNDFNEFDVGQTTQMEDTLDNRAERDWARMNGNKATLFPAPVTHKKRKKISSSEKIAKCLQQVADSINYESSSSRQFTIQECMDVLGRMSSVQEGSKLWLYATRVLLKPAIREMFLAIKSDASRLMWLEGQMEEDMQRRGCSTGTFESGGRGSIQADNASSG